MDLVLWSTMEQSEMLEREEGVPEKENFVVDICSWSLMGAKMRIIRSCNLCVILNSTDQGTEMSQPLIPRMARMDDLLLLASQAI